MKKIYLPIDVRVRLLDETADIVSASFTLDENEGGIVGGGNWWESGFWGT